MVILERPFVSDLMVDTLKNNNIPVLRNEMAEERVADGNVLSDEEFSAEYGKRGKMYTVSENALGWIYEHIDDKRFLDSISLVKDKYAFRRICRDIYPDFFFKEVNINEMAEMDTDNITFPCVIKPSVGFLSKGVFVANNPEEYRKAVASLQRDFATAGAGFPEFVVGKSRFLIEEYIHGEEYAVDTYFDENETPAILNIFHHKFMDESDTSDRLYMTSKVLFDRYEGAFTQFLTNLNNTLHLRNFPMHIEFRYDGRKAVPIEINPLRFTGFCLNELQVFISGQHPMLSYLRGTHVTKEEMWRGKENLTYAFTVLDLPAGCEEKAFDDEKFSADFPYVIDVRLVPDKTSGVAATVFLRTETANEAAFDRIMSLDMQEYMR
ncbi:MAG: ATP-grasp domain-containing protein [Bacteroidales bacterium]|nr:ATP-grasp domain-containing protein [Bacteroidales bacterium]